jgi:proliferating cell nuclear antigen
VRGVFKAELEDVGLIQDSMKTISDLISEGTFQFTEEGVKLIAADSAMVALVDFQIEKDVFEDYELDEEEKIGLNLENLYSILRKANSNDTITFKIGEDDSQFHIIMESSSTRNFSLPILNLSEDDIASTDQLEFSVDVDMETKVLEDSIKDALVVGDSVTVSSDGDSLSIQAEGDDADGINSLEGTSARSMFSLDYLNSMAGAKKLSDTVQIRLGEDLPMILNFDVPEKARLSFVLAPRIEQD